MIILRAIALRFAVVYYCLEIMKHPMPYFTLNICGQFQRSYSKDENAHDHQKHRVK